MKIETIIKKGKIYKNTPVPVWIGEKVFQGFVAKYKNKTIIFYVPIEVLIKTEEV